MQSIGFPIKGVNRITSRSTQPQGTAYDMLNVLPYDTEGRLRGAKRRGTAKLWADQLGVDADAVVLLDQVTLTEIPEVTGASWTEPFTYSNGDLASVSSAAWAIKDTTAGGTTTRMVVSSNKATVVPDAGDVSPITAFATQTTQQDYNLESGYTVTADIVLGYNDASFFSGSFQQFTFEIESAVGATDAGVTSAISVEFFDDSADGTSTQVSVFGDGELLAGVSTMVSGWDAALKAAILSRSFTLKFVVSAGTGTNRTCQIFIDDNLLVLDMDGSTFGGTYPLRAKDDAKKGVAFMLGFMQRAANAGSVDNIAITQPGDLGSPRETKIVTVASRDVYVGNLNTVTLATSGGNAIAANVNPQGCYSAGKYYFVDGGTIKQLDISSETVETYTATAGTAPTGCTVCCMWRDRLVVAGPDQNVYFSRVGVHTDWDYSQTDPGAAFAANASESGHIGEPVVALMPLTDDNLGIGGDHNLWVVRGDPADGGSIDEVSNAIGLLGPKAWCRDPEGMCYFLGTGGMFKWTGGLDKPEPIDDDKWTDVFANINRGRSILNLVWHRDRKGCYVFLTKTGRTITEAPTHLWYDRRLDALFPLELPIGHGPTAALVYDGDGPTDRIVLIGGRDGYVRAFNESRLHDDGDPIEAYVVFGPIALGDDDNDGLLTKCNVTLGEPDGTKTVADYGVTVSIRAGLTAYDVTAGEATRKLHKFSRRYDGQIGRLNSIVTPLRGVFAAVELYDNSTDKTFNFEQLAYTTQLAGTSRR